VNFANRKNNSFQAIININTHKGLLTLKTKFNLTQIIAVFWIIIVVGGYYLIHEPLPDGMFFSFLQSVWVIISVLMVLILAGGIGFLTLKLEEYPGLVRGVIQASLGLGIQALFVLLLGSIWRINTYFIFFLVPFFLVVYHRGVMGWLRIWREALIEQWVSGGKMQRLIILLIASLFFVMLITALAPPIKYDALNYHLTLPKTYLLNQKITDLPWLVMSGMPQTTEMLYLVVMALCGESAPLLMNWVFGLLTILGLVGFLSNRIDSLAAWVGAAALLSGFTLVSALAWGYVGWLSALFGLCTLVLLDTFYHNDGDKQTIFNAGLFAGLAFSTKYPAGVMMACGGVVLTWIVFRLKQGWWPIVWRFVLGALIFSAPWLLKNLIMTGNPLYPFFFEAGAMDAVRIGVYQGSPTFGDWTDFAFLPLKAVLTGVEGAPGYSVSLGPLLLGLGLLAFLGWTFKSKNEKMSLIIAGIISLTGIVIWSVGNQLSGYLVQTRFYFVLFPTFASLAGFGYFELQKIKSKRNWFGKFIYSIILLVLVFNLVQIGAETNHKGAASVLFGQKSRQDYLYDNLGWYAVALDEIEKLPESSKVMMFYEPRGYGCVPKCDPDEILDRWKTENIRYENFQTMEKAWRESGFSHLLVYTIGVEFLRGDNDPHHPISDLQALDTYLATLKTPLDIGGVYALYTIPD
jgi:hypothetical protein